MDEAMKTRLSPGEGEQGLREGFRKTPPGRPAVRVISLFAAVAGANDLLRVPWSENLSGNRVPWDRDVPAGASVTAAVRIAGFPAVFVVFLGVIVVQCGKYILVLRDFTLLVYGVNRTNRFTGSAINTFVGMNEEHCFGLIDVFFRVINAINGAHFHTRPILRVHAGFCDNISHDSEYSRRIVKKMRLAVPSGWDASPSFTGTYCCMTGLIIQKVIPNRNPTTVPPEIPGTSTGMA